jgi:hypothetical protein
MAKLTVKTWSKKDGHFWLLPANDNYAPIPADDAEILGKVTAVLSLALITFGSENRSCLIINFINHPPNKSSS